MRIGVALKARGFIFVYLNQAALHPKTREPSLHVSIILILLETCTCNYNRENKSGQYKIRPEISDNTYRHHELDSVDEDDEHDEVGVDVGRYHLPQLVPKPFLVVWDVFVLRLHFQRELYATPLWGQLVELGTSDGKPNWYGENL